jgi:hypothetical protein
MARGGQSSGQRQAFAAPDPEAGRSETASAGALAAEAPPAPSVAPPVAPAEQAPESAPASAPSRATRFVVIAGIVHHDGKAYEMGQAVPVTEAQAMLMPWALERR